MSKYSRLQLLDGVGDQNAGIVIIDVEKAEMWKRSSAESHRL
jgi:hypothetical protein